MYISEIVIEGFKSYAQRVTLSNFDQAFNAITGLNGSGKSNILDSICFVLGIKNLTQVRATNLQELVYKQGQAGISKATVSITWHNDDPENGPAGHKDKEYITITRQVVIGGRNKYMINGHAAQESRVQDLFHSVQLNVNNPHFLIMQGRITKVLNMKPPEILSLLEEAAGTRMYEKKKEQAERTLEKKQARLEQIDSVLDQDIKPALDALRAACKQYTEWAQLSSQQERLKRLLVVYDYCEFQKIAQRIAADIASLDVEIAKLSEKKASITAELEEQRAMVRDLQSEKEIQAGGEIKELQRRADALSMDLTKDSTSWKAKQEQLASEQKALAAHQAALAELATQDLAGQVAAAEAVRQQKSECLAAAEAALKAAQRELAGAEAGDGRDESNRSLQERLADAQTEQTHADAAAKKADMQVKLLKQQLAEARKAASSKQSEAAGLTKELAKQTAAMEAATARTQALGFDAAAFAQLERERAQLATDVRSKRDEVDRLAQDVAGCDFRYSSPGPNFRPAAVHGVVARLVRVQDPSTSMALEVAAGGKLYQVVVDDEGTAKQLLEKGRLTKRVTIIPLNKVQYATMPGSVLEAAAKMSQGKARPALELVGYAGNVEAAIKYAFGGAFVCQDAGAAKKLAFSREVGMRCVTLEGDDFNPSGLLTGGSRSSSRSLLASLHALSLAEAALATVQERLSAVDAQLKDLAAAGKEHRRLQQEAELAAHSLALLKDRMAGSQAAQLAAAAEGLERELEEASAAAQAAKAEMAALVDSASALEQEIANFSKERDKRLKGAQDKLKKAKAGLEAAKRDVRTAEQALAAAQAEHEAGAVEAAALQAKVASAQASIQSLEVEVEALRAASAKAREAYEACAAQLEARRARLRECDAEITAASRATGRLERSVQDLDVDVKKQEHKLRSKAAEAKLAAERTAMIERDFSWVASEKASFGKGDYDFSKHDIPKLKTEYERIETRVGELKGKVNQKCIDKLEKAEREYEELTQKRKTVANDRERITQVINQLDDLKKVSMEKTWTKVDEDFGSIFSTLLPGTQAKLEPPQGATFLDGLEVRVAFGGVWKESLTELSGGQRSLLALSLILALCRFKPAPLYILDEVDAALDLNHTQNIGRMIKQHFPESQFIVVSLKEGMFSNANVIFRTKFVDGVSTVTRTVPSAAERAMRGPIDELSKGSKGQPSHGTLPAGRSALRDANR
ncbi:structural maintenance of chromosomes protein 2 [Haematococcus lacustris]